MALSASGEIKRNKAILIRMVNLTRSNENHFFAKIMELFYSLDERFQRDLLKFVVDKKDLSQKLKDVMAKDDNTLYPYVIRALLLYFSGNKDFGEPSKDDFAAAVYAYSRSPNFDGKPTFIEELGAL